MTRRERAAVKHQREKEQVAIDKKNDMIDFIAMVCNTRQFPV
jgi:hypothetical protein